MENAPRIEDFVKQIWWNRWRIVGITLAFAVITAGVSLILPKTYEAEAQLMVLPSQSQLDLGSETPAVQTVQMLLTSPKYLREVKRWLIEGIRILDYLTEGEKLSPEYIQGLRMTSPYKLAATTYSLEVARYVTQLDEESLRGLRDFDLDDLEDTTLEDLGESLFADVTEEKKTAIDIIFSPIIKLRARGKTGRQAAMLANVWAAVFLDVYGNLVRTNAQRNLDFWSSATERLRNQRAGKLEEIREFRLGYNLEFLQEWLDEASVDFRELQADFNRQQLEVDQETSRIVSLSRALEAVEDNGTWIGATTASAPVEKPGVAGRFREMRQNVIASTERVARLTERVGAFNDRHNLDILRAEAERALYDLVDYRSRLKKATVEVEQTSKTLAGVLNILASTEPTMAVERAGDEGAAEIVNPAWEELQYERIRLEVARDEAVATREKLATYIDELAKDAQAQAARLARLEIEHEQIRNNLDLALEEYNGYQQAYGDLKREMYNAAQNIGPLQSRAQHLAQATGQLNARIDDAMTSITNGQTGLTLRESEDETWEEYVKLATENLREAELAASRTSLDVYVAAEAIPPTKKIWPQRTLMVIVMTFLGFFVAIAWVCGRYYMVSTGLLTR